MAARVVGRVAARVAGQAAARVEGPVAARVEGQAAARVAVRRHGYRNRNKYWDCYRYRRRNGVCDRRTGRGGRDDSGATQDIASTETVPPVPGLYGNQYELQVDVSRLPRVDEFQRMASDSLTNSLQDIPSDVKTVAYYCVNASSLGSAGVVNRRTGKAESGLVRRVMDRAVTLCASDNGNLQGLQQVAEVVAPEVTSIEFQYFDGTQWLLEWDSDEMGGLPMAVKITMLLAASTTPAAEAGGLSQRSGNSPASADQVYSLVVRLPTAKPATSESTTDSSGMEAVGL